jgi:DNA primase catalytic core
MCCPFHDDKTPSLKVSIEKNVFNCFGCDAKGTVIDWVIKTQGVSFRHACEILANDAGMDLDAQSPKKNTVPKLSSPLTEQAENQIVLKQVITYYQESLKQSPEAIEYLKKRGLTNSELIDTFKLGFANRTLGLRLPHKNRVAGKQIRSQLQEIGIYRKSGHEHFNGSIVIPIIDENNQITEVYGRKVRDDLRKGTPTHLYLPGPHCGVFNLASFKASDEIILCESLIDALTFWNHGFRNVTTSYGTGGFTDEILQAFKANNIKRVLIAYDRDKAGDSAADELSKKLNSQGMDTYRILFPKNMDANEYALSVKPAAKSLGIVIRKAQWMANADGSAETAGSRMVTLKVTNENKEQKKEPAKTTSSKKAAESDETILAAKNEKIIPLASPTELPEPSAQVIPQAGSTTNAEISDHEVNITFGQSDKMRKYRVRGLSKNMSYNQLKLNVHVMKNDRYYIDTFDLYHARSRTTYIKQASIELGHDINVIKKDMGRILIKLEELQEQQIKATLNTDKKPVPTMSEQAYSQAIELLKSPNLLDRITKDLTASGIIGEDINKLTGYLACVSRKLDRPLAIIIQSTSAAGKSSLMDAILSLMPDEEMTQYSAMTGQSLFYMGETNLKNKILAICEEEGAQNASYALKLLQSEGELTIASTGKDETSGKMETKEYHVQGPVMLFMTTTAIDIDEELMNRCLVLTVNESREQTQAIHNMQRKMHTIDGILAKQSKNKLIELHQNAQRLIKPMLVANPYAEELTFINDKTRTRRDHMKYLTLINSITLLHQHQRKIKTINHNGETLQYIEVTKTDIAMANKLAHEILGRSLDELPPQTRTLLKLVHKMVKKRIEEEAMKQCDYLFSRREIREYCKWTDPQVKKHISRLQDMEYLLVHRGGRGQSFVYELLYNNEGQDGQNFVLGLKELIDSKDENHQYDNQKNPQNNKLNPSNTPRIPPKNPHSNGKKKAVNLNNTNGFKQISGKTLKNTRPEVEKTDNRNHALN